MSERVRLAPDYSKEEEVTGRKTYGEMTLAELHERESELHDQLLHEQRTKIQLERDLETARIRFDNARFQKDKVAFWIGLKEMEEPK